MTVGTESALQQLGPTVDNMYECPTKVRASMEQ